MNTLSIPVPSRLYADVPNARPLEGVRVAVKDIYDMAGLRTACGNRAYFLTYPEREVNAVAVQRLIDQGAVILGRTKTSSFANGESPTADWVDQLDAFNPRGDEWQSTSSSSAGSGAAIAAYDWVDVTLGTDTYVRFLSLFFLTLINAPLSSTIVQRRICSRTCFCSGHVRPSTLARRNRLDQHHADGVCPRHGRLPCSYSRC